MSTRQTRMFKRRTPENAETAVAETGNAGPSATRPASSPADPAPPANPAKGFEMPTPQRPDFSRLAQPQPNNLVRRPGEPASEPAAPTQTAGSITAHIAPRRLLVGRDITMSGEINACDQLVIEGTVDARVPDGHRVEISESGLFNGTAEIHEADIAGTFEGELVCRGRLTLRATGRVNGKISYGELEIEAGGQIEGQISAIGVVEPARTVQESAEVRYLKEEAADTQDHSDAGESDEEVEAEAATTASVDDAYDDDVTEEDDEERRTGTML